MIRVNGHSVDVRGDNLIVNEKIIPHEILKCLEGLRMLSSGFFGTKAVVGENEITIRRNKVKVNGVKLNLASLPDAHDLEIENDTPMDEAFAPTDNHFGGITVNRSFKNVEQTITTINGKVVFQKVKVNGKTLPNNNGVDESLKKSEEKGQSQLGSGE